LGRLQSFATYNNLETGSRNLPAYYLKKSGKLVLSGILPGAGTSQGIGSAVRAPGNHRLCFWLAGIAPLKTVPVTGPLLEPVDIFFTKDFGAFLMVRAANMKITIDKETTVIVNISGGGCPDVPYLAAEMVGRKLLMRPRPDPSGTPCAGTRDLAYEEMTRTKRCLQ
jgi:hypothetical protein